MLPLVVTAVIAAATATVLGGGPHAVASQIALALPARAMDLARLGATIGALAGTIIVLGGRVAGDLQRIRTAASSERGRGDLVGLAVAAGVGVVGHGLLEPLARDMSATAIGAGLGLLATSVALGSIGVARTPVCRFASPAVGALAGAGLAMGALPGGAPIALAIAALVWSGLAEIDAFEIATLAALPLHAVALACGLDEGTLSAVTFAPGHAAAAAAIGAVAASLAIVGLRRLARAGSLAMTALYTGTLSLALFGYAYVAAP